MSKITELQSLLDFKLKELEEINLNTFVLNKNISKLINEIDEIKETILKEIIGEISGVEDVDYNKVDTALKSIGVQLKNTNGQFRDLDDILLELSQKWDTFDKNSQRYQEDNDNE